MINYSGQRVGVFIDVQNMYYSARHLYQQKVNFGNIVKEAVGERKLIRALAYVVRTKSGEEIPFIEALAKQGLEIREKELLEYFSGQKKADWDVGITVDIVKMLDMLDVVVLVSGDGDYKPLCDYVQSRGRMIEIMSFRESTSTMLLEGIDGYIDLGEEKRKFLIGPKGSASAKTDIKKISKTRKTAKQTRSKKSKEEPTETMFDESPDKSEEEMEERRGRKLTF